MDRPYLWIKIADEDVGTNVQILLVRRCLIHPHLNETLTTSFLNITLTASFLNITLTASFLITPQYSLTGFPKSFIMFMIFIE